MPPSPLPYDLVEEILSYFCDAKRVQLSILVDLCLVSHSFREICRPAVFRDLRLKPNLANNAPEDRTQLEHCEKLLAALQSSPELCDCVRSLEIFNLSLAGSDTTWLIPEYELVCALLDTCGSLQTLAIIPISQTEIFWNDLPSPLRASLSKVFASPCLRTLDLRTRLVFYNSKNLFLAFPMHADSGLRHLTVTDWEFLPSIDAALSSVDAEHTQRALDSLSVNYVGSDVQGPELIAALHHEASPFSIKRLSQFTITGLSELDRWVCDVLDSQETAEILEKLGFHGIFRIDPAFPFTHNLERFSRITELTVNVYPTVLFHRRADHFKGSLEAMPRQALQTLQKITVFARDDLDFEDLKDIDIYCNPDMTPALIFCGVALESKREHPSDQLRRMKAEVSEALPQAAVRGILNFEFVEWGYIPTMEQGGI